MYLLFDIGGTKMRISTPSDGEDLDKVESFDTPPNFDDAISTLSKFKEKPIEKVVGGIAGVLDKSKNKLVRSPNLHGWVNTPIKNRLEGVFETKVVLENDAALAGLGEASFGAGKGKEIVAYLTISTGIGGARIVDGKIDTTNWGFEPGRQIIDIDKSLWPECVNFNPEYIPPGSVESYASGAALNFRYGKPSYDIEDEDVWGQVEKFLTVAIYNTIAYWSPEIIILGGGMVSKDAVSLENIKNDLGSMVKIFPDIPEVVKAQLNDKSGLYGALSLLKNNEPSND
ncbi:ROK family protein [Patescibacteria group bacterium]